MSVFRTGNHWGVTIVRSPSGSQERAEGDELVAVVVNGDRELAERICELLNGEPQLEDLIGLAVRAGYDVTLTPRAES